MAKKRRRIPQPPIDPQRHPTGIRPIWWPVIVVLVGGAMVALGPWRVHDVFGDGQQLVPEWQLTEAVTRGGIKRLEPTPPTPPLPATTMPPGQAPVTDIDQGAPPPAVKDKAPDVENGDDYCKT